MVFVFYISYIILGYISKVYYLAVSIYLEVPTLYLVVRYLIFLYYNFYTNVLHYLDHWYHPYF